MSVKSKRRARKRQLAEQAKAESASRADATSREDETFTLNSILADFRANKELEQAAEGIKPVKDADIDFDGIPKPGEVIEHHEPEPEDTPEMLSESSEIAERLSYLFAADKSAKRPPDEPTERLPDTFTVDEPAERLPDISKVDESVTFTAETPLPEYVSDTFSTEEAAERFFDQFMTDENPPESVTETASEAVTAAELVTETPSEGVTAAEFVTETPSETVTAAEFVAGTPPETVTAAETVTETPSETVTAAELVTETPSETVTAAELVAGTPSETVTAAELVTETPSETVTAAELVTETPSETVTAAETVTDNLSEAVTESLSDTVSGAAENVSDTQSFAETASAPTFLQRMFGRSKPRKDVPEPAEDAEPRSVSLEEVVGNTVDAVKADAVPKRSLFSRRRLEDTGDELPEPAHPEVIGPEPDLKTAAEEARKEYVKRVEGLLPALVPALLPLLVLVLEAVGLRLPLLTGSVILRPLLLLGCLGVTLWLCRSVFTDNRCTATFLCGVSAVAAALDCVTMPFLSGRSMAEPYGAVACLALLTAKLGSSLESHGAYDTFHTAALDRNPPYLVTNSVYGTCKRRGNVTGFYTAALAQNFSTRWQMFSMPVTLAASLVFAALSSVGIERGGDFFLNWSAILAAGATLVLPFCWGLPWARLASRLKKSGCAIAGWRGAEQMSRKKKIIVTDSDLFPPGAVRLEDTRVYEGEMPAVVSVTASMIRESGCGLERVFDDLLKSEGGDYLPVRDFHFYEDGGFSGTIEEDKILLGTSSFLRKMSVRFPGDFYFPMGLYLSVNGELIATFALKYEAMENVNSALRILRRNRVTVILAARDPNLTPKLLQRVFRRRVDVEYPGLNNRISLSAARTNRELPRGLLFREGLSPYAEIMVGSLRLCGGVRRATRLALFGSIVGTLLAFYLVYQAKYYLLSPLNLLLFLFLWTVPTLLLMDLS